MSIKKADTAANPIDMARYLSTHTHQRIIDIEYIHYKKQENKKMEVTITTENFESYKNGDLPLVVDLWATWCGHCRMVGPIISELAKEYDGKLVVGKCDVEENDEIAADFGVRNIPTILFFKNGELVDKFVGAANKATIEEKFKALL